MRWHQLGALIAAVLLGLVPPPAAGATLSPPPTRPADRRLVLATADRRFTLQLSVGLQGRYTFVAYDHEIVGNEENSSSFYLRRARMWLEGHVYDPRLTYTIQLQLEPAAGAALLDAWVEYTVSDWLAVGGGRNKIAYGLEFLNSGFALNFIDRSIMYGETEIDRGGAFSSYPGGGSQPLSTSAQHPSTGFPVGGLHLYRSQGVQLAGRGNLGRPAVEYQLGVWQGRNSRAASNDADRHLVAARVGVHPLGAIDCREAGDLSRSDRLKFALIASAYAASTLHRQDAHGTQVPTYEADDGGTNLAAMLRSRGLSADLEWGRERYLVHRDLPGDWSWDREAWRIALGALIVPRRVEVVARYAAIERLKSPTPEAIAASGLGFATVRVNGEEVSAMERRIDELTGGANLYLDGHRHKLSIDFSRLRRSFADHLGIRPDDQIDLRIRTMYQLKL